jgi:hypothetical protein
MLEGFPLCIRHDPTEAGLAATLRHWPRYAKLSHAGGMYWLTEVNGVAIEQVDAYTSPYQAMLAWAKAQVAHA